MPNHVKIKLTIKGPDEDVKRFVTQARGRPPATGDAPGHINANRDDLPEMPLNFHSVVPLPAEYGKVPYSSLGKPNGCDMECETWGAKWGAYDQEEPVVEEGCASYSFTCAWGHPDKWLRKAAASWPALKFFMSYGGEGPTRGRFTYQRDKEPKRWPEKGAARYPSDDEGLDDDEYGEQHDLAEEHFIRTHRAWAESTL
jgi:hypothetical protein